MADQKFLPRGPGVPKKQSGHGDGYENPNSEGSGGQKPGEGKRLDNTSRAFPGKSKGDYDLSETRNPGLENAKPTPGTPQTGGSKSMEGYDNLGINQDGPTNMGKAGGGKGDRRKTAEPGYQ